MKKVTQILIFAFIGVVRGTVAVPCLILTGLFLIAGCKKDNPVISGRDGEPGGESAPAYYIMGYNVQSGVYIEDETGKAEQYLLVSEDLKDTLATCNFPDDLFTFSSEIVKPVNICGFTLFPEEYRFAYKVQMTYRPMTEEELKEAFYICNTLWVVMYNIHPEYVFITSISKIK